jgi:biotin carboxylase
MTEVIMSTVLLVHAKSGPPPSHAIPKVAAAAETHLLAITPLPPAALDAARQCCASIVDVSGERLRGESLVERIVTEARLRHATAVLSLSEFAQLAVSQAAEQLGLRGCGPHAARARNKRLMRRAWAARDVPVPRWRPVDSVEDLFDAWSHLAPPILLKSAWSAAAVGQVMIKEKEEIPLAWDLARSGVRAGEESWFTELNSALNDEFLADEIIPSTTRSWFEDPRYGDHLSVEGLVVNGRYHPVCITAKPRTIAPFTERGNFTPCVLPEELQRRVEDQARQAVNALGLQTCGTHTELKLMADNQVCMLETAARFGGVMVVREVEAVYGVDLIGALVRALLGEDPDLPPRMLTGAGRCAAGSVAMYAVDARGNPWRTRPVFDASAIDWTTIVSPGTQVDIVPDLTLPAGSPMPPYDPGNGYLNSAGLLYLTSPTAEQLVNDAHAIMDGLEGALAS